MDSSSIRSSLVSQTFLFVLPSFRWFGILETPNPENGRDYTIKVDYTAIGKIKKNREIKKA
jgi:hypothetical protein